MRIASLQPSITLTLAALERLDALCAVTKYCLESIPALAAHRLPILHDSWSFDTPGNLEILLASRPEIVVASVPYRMESLATILKSGLPVLARAPHGLADVYADIRLIAALVQAGPASLIAQMQRTVADTQGRTAHCTLETKAARLLRGVGQAADPLPTLGRRAGGGRGRQISRYARLHCIPDEYLNTPAPTLLEGLACIAAAQPSLHPPHRRLITLQAD